MKIISWNVGGIQSRYNDGALNEIFDLKPDIFCIQEVHQKPRNLNQEILCKKDYNGFFYPSSKYEKACGVAVYSKYDPISLKNGFNNTKFDVEARIQTIEYEEFNLFNVYFPTGSGNENFKDKSEFYDLFTKYVKKSRKPQVICGDFNRISTINDTYHSKYNGPGFKKEEKEWFESFLNRGFIDTFRLFNKESGNYTWWSRRGTLREENKGFRFDYFLVNEELKGNVVDARILHQIPTDDHAPISLELTF